MADKVILTLMDHVYNSAKVSADHVRGAVNEWGIAHLNKGPLPAVGELPIDMRKLQYEEYLTKTHELKNKWLKSKKADDLREWLLLPVPTELSGSN